MSLLSNLTGKQLYWSILSGGKKMIEHQEEINKINVFPVPDGDTGSNLAATATSIIYNSKEDADIETVASSIGDAALDGARGNSGVIFAQFLYSIAQEMKGVATLSTKKFAETVKKASKYVYDAIPSPQEGTIITVIREWAEFIDSKKDEILDFETLFVKAEEVAQKALARTAEQLEAMRLAKVVDAGAKGFVLFIEGMKDTIIKRAFTRDDHDMEHLLMADADMPIAEAETLTEESLHNRYCTETCIIGQNIDKHAVQELLETDSDSIVMAGGDNKLRLHFHTNHPAQMLDKLRKFGKFTFQKVEDMRRQYTTTHHRSHSIALVTDSGVSLSPEYLDENQIHQIPFVLDINGDTYYDFKTFDVDLMIQRKGAEKGFKLKTSQPSPKTFADMFLYLSKYYDSVIVMTVSQKVSGTYNSALQGVDLVKKTAPNLKIDVIDTKHMAAGGGALAHCVMDDINKGLSHDEVVENARKQADHSNNFINFRTIDHMIASGRLGAFQGNIIKTLRLCPVLDMPDGTPQVTGKAFGFQKAFQKTLDAIKTSLDNASVRHYVIAHSITDTTDLDRLVKKVTDVIGFAPSDVSLVPPSVATHVGLDALCIGVMYGDK
ncbi:MAG: DegV family protein [Brevinema sp.]